MHTDLPKFSAIRPERIEPTIRELIEQNRRQLAALLDSGAAAWDSLVEPLEEMQHTLARTWSPVGHMNGVVNNDDLRAALGLGKRLDERSEQLVLLEAPKHLETPGLQRSHRPSPSSRLQPMGRMRRVPGTMTLTT